MKNKNIWDTPWVSVTNNLGNVELVTFEDYLNNCQNYIWFAGEGSAIQDISIFRFTLSLLHWGIENVYSLPYKDIDDELIDQEDDDYTEDEAKDSLDTVWADIYKKGYVPKEVITWLKKETYDYFWLYSENDKPGLLQVIVKENSEEIKPYWVFSDYWESNNKYSYAKNRDKNEIPNEDELIRGIITRQLCNDKAWKNLAKNDPKDYYIENASFINTLYHYIRSDNIFNSLMFSLVMYPSSDFWAKDKMLFIKDLPKYCDENLQNESIDHCFGDLTYHAYAQFQLTCETDRLTLSRPKDIKGKTVFKGFSIGYKADIIDSPYAATYTIKDKKKGVVTNLVKPIRSVPIWSNLVFDSFTTNKISIQYPGVISWIANIRKNICKKHNLTITSPMMIACTGMIPGNKGMSMLNEVQQGMKYNPKLFEDETNYVNAKETLSELSKVIKSYCIKKKNIMQKVYEKKDSNNRPDEEIYKLDSIEFNSYSKYEMDLITKLNPYIDTYLLSDITDTDKNNLFKKVFETLKTDSEIFKNKIKREDYVLIMQLMSELNNILRGLYDSYRKN